MIIGLRKKLNASCFRQLPERGKYIGTINFKLFHQCSAERITYLEFSIMFFYQVEDYLIGAQITFIRNFVQYLYIFFIILIKMILAYIEKRISLDPEWLMNLEVETDGRHNLGIL